jgi:hypothetical protein
MWKERAQARSNPGNRQVCSRVYCSSSVSAPLPSTVDKRLRGEAGGPHALHRELVRFAEKFVRSSWGTTPQDLGRLRGAGLSDRDIVQWATLGSTQSWFTMSADGGGIPLEGEALTGPGVGRTCEAYAATREGLLGASSAAGISC